MPLPVGRSGKRNGVNPKDSRTQIQQAVQKARLANKNGNGTDTSSSSSTVAAAAAAGINGGRGASQERPSSNDIEALARELAKAIPVVTDSTSPDFFVDFLSRLPRNSEFKTEDDARELMLLLRQEQKEDGIDETAEFSEESEPALYIATNQFFDKKHSPSRAADSTSRSALSGTSAGAAVSAAMIEDNGAGVRPPEQSASMTPLTSVVYPAVKEVERAAEDYAPPLLLGLASREPARELLRNFLRAVRHVPAGSRSLEVDVDELLKLVEEEQTPGDDDEGSLVASLVTGYEVLLDKYYGKVSRRSAAPPPSQAAPASKVNIKQLKAAAKEGGVAAVGKVPFGPVDPILMKRMQEEKRILDKKARARATTNEVNNRAAVKGILGSSNQGLANSSILQKKQDEQRDLDAASAVNGMADLRRQIEHLREAQHRLEAEIAWLKHRSEAGIATTRKPDTFSVLNDPILLSLFSLLVMILVSVLLQRVQPGFSP